MKSDQLVSINFLINLKSKILLDKILIVND